MHKYQQRLLFGFAIAFMLPAMAMAAPPEPVSGVSASAEEDGSVRVQWDAVEGQTAARVYWSYISILENNGEYDDYAIVEGSANEYVIVDPPAVDTLYVAVIAENADGEQSPFFTEEASVEVKSAQTDQSSTPPSSSSSAQTVVDEFSSMSSAPFSAWAVSSVTQAASSAAPVIANDGRFHLLTATAAAPTQLILTFSHPVILNPNDAARAFTVATVDGRLLPLLRLEILGQNVTLTTDTQERGVPYVVTASAVVQGAQISGGQQIAVQFPNLVESVSFTGHPFGKEPVTGPTDTSFTLQATPVAGGMFRIETSLTNIPHEGIVRYDVYQSLDGGRTYSPPQSVSAETPSIRVDNVAQGAFVMMLQPVAADGGLRSPLVASVLLGSGTVPPPPASSAAPLPVSSRSSSSSAGTVTRPPSTMLPGSGAGIVTLLGAGSAWTMMRLRRRRIAA